MTAAPRMTNIAEPINFAIHSGKIIAITFPMPIATNVKINEIKLIIILGNVAICIFRRPYEIPIPKASMLSEIAKSMAEKSHIISSPGAFFISLCAIMTVCLSSDITPVAREYICQRGQQSQCAKFLKFAAGKKPGPRGLKSQGDFSGRHTAKLCVGWPVDKKSTGALRPLQQA